MIRHLAPLLALSLLSAAQSAAAGINTQIVASRVSGVAPLAVFFDATTTSSTATSKPFHDLHFAWDFGDSNAGEWVYGNPNSNDKNRAFGPVAAHVFESPGTYHVRLEIKGLNGDKASRSTTITVQNPNTVFSGVNTVCFSTSGNYSGCPNGARHITTSSFQSAMASATQGKRLLFRRGETWIAMNESRISNRGPGLIGAFGDGVRPIIRNTSSEDLIKLSRGRSGLTNDWRLMDLNFVGASNSSEMVRSDNTVKNFLMLRLKGRNFLRFNAIGNSAIEYYQSATNENIFMVENDFEDSGMHGSYTSAEGLAILGNRLKDAPNSHVVRITYANPVVFSNNDFLGGAQSNRSALKFHSFQPDKASIYNHSSSGQFVISDNIMNALRAAWPFTLGPESSSGNRPQNVRKGIIERNQFTSSVNTHVMMKLWTSEVTVRNNLFDQIGSGISIDLDRRNYENAPHNNSFYNNTFHAVTNNPTAITIQSVVRNTSVRNNLFYTGNGAGLVVSGSAYKKGNLLLAGLPQTDPNRFKPVGKAINGARGALALDDFKSYRRPLFKQDVGALETRGSSLSSIYSLLLD